MQTVCVDLQAVGALEFFGELYSLAKGFGPFLRGFGQALEKGRVLFLVTTSILPSLQAYAELHALSPLRGSISPWCGPDIDCPRSVSFTSCLSFRVKGSNQMRA